jgi:hypothetical protein
VNPVFKPFKAFKPFNPLLIPPPRDAGEEWNQRFERLKPPKRVERFEPEMREKRDAV